MKTNEENLEREFDDELDVPATLLELLKGDWRAEGYVFTKVYVAVLKHGLMGDFPVVFSDKLERPVITTDLNLLEKVCQRLRKRAFKINAFIAYFNPTNQVIFPDRDNPLEYEYSRPTKILNEEEFENLVAQAMETEPFRWAPGLLGGGNLTEENFSASFVNEAKRFDPRFKSTFI
ncbi:MAG: hypothetical protein WCT18_00235 [Patescibacteria group bacterium]